MSRRSPHRLTRAGLGFLLACGGVACEPELVVGTRVSQEPACSPSVPEGGADAGAGAKVIEVGWSTGFEDGFCDYERAGGICYARPGASYELVEDPVHGGNSAVAFSVNSATATDSHTRCFLEGELPGDAVYVAWFLVPELAANTGNWNLFHFRSGTEPPLLHGIWDVSIGNADDGSLFLYIYDFLNPGGGVRPPTNPRAVPIGSWFQVEFRLRRAPDATGEVALYQDGVLVHALTGVITDDGQFAQWYAGNLADALTPAESTVYVDDVSIRAP